MPTLKGPASKIYYEVYGSGYPLMIFAPGGQPRSAPGAEREILASGAGFSSICYD